MKKFLFTVFIFIITVSMINIFPNVSISPNETITSVKNRYAFVRATKSAAPKCGTFKRGKILYKGLKSVNINNSTSYIFFKRNGNTYNSGLKTLTIDGKKETLYFQPNGIALTNHLKSVYSGGKAHLYYFDENGNAISNSWLEIDGKQYYFGKDCTAVTGKKNISHYLCYFNSDGSLRRQIDKDQKMIALTYDDGPAKGTPRILKVLEENNSVATFFVVGNRVNTYKKYVKQAYNMGCEIGNHSFNHVILTKVNADRIKAEYKKTNAVIKRVTGSAPKLLRPPGGAVNDTERQTVKMPLIIWSVDTLDWKTKNADATIKAVLGSVKDGDIVLMHDLWEPTATASEKFIPELINEGYQLVTVSELAECRGEKLKKGQTYHSLRK